MANPSPKKITCRIKNIEPDPKHPGRMIVAVEFDDGNKELGPWIQGFSLLPEKVLTLEDFIDSLYQREIERPQDPYQHLKRVMQEGKSFELDLSAKIEPGK